SAGDIKLMTFKEFNSFKLMNDFELIDCCDETLPVNTTEFGEPIETKKTRSFFVELEGGMARFSKNEISISNNSEKILTVDPSPIREWNMGVNVGVKKGNWYLFSGINYHEFTQKFNTQIRSMDSNLSISYNQRQETQYFETFVRNIVSKVPNGSGFSYELTGTEYKSDTVLVNVTDTVFDWSEVEVTESEKQEYRTQYLQIPLAIGYTHSIKSKWLLEGFVRTDIGFLMNQKGTYYNETDETFYPLNESSNASKITFSCQLGVGVGYRLTDAMSIQIRPSYRQILKGPFDSDNYNRSGVGVNAAIRFKL
ncbi:MAG: outer membrane beta-barrel protein, partial [Salibacteraceae bacterium]